MPLTGQLSRFSISPYRINVECSTLQSSKKLRLTEMTLEKGKTYHINGEGTKRQEATLRQRLRLKWLPFGDGAKPEAIDQYERFLALADDEQRVFVATLDADEAELYIALMAARAMYVDPTVVKMEALRKPRLRPIPNGINGSRSNAPLGQSRCLSGPVRRHLILPSIQFLPERHVRDA